MVPIIPREEPLRDQEEMPRLLQGACAKQVERTTRCKKRVWTRRKAFHCIPDELQYAILLT
jgi:hypothetical protein